MNRVRLLIDDPLPGPVNMARDEALLQACVPDSAPTLRFYAWKPPTISLGYFQDYAEYERLEPPAGDLAVVRRTTGGGAILHDLEVTYSLVIPLTHPLVHGKPNDLYRLAHRAIISAIGTPARMLGEGGGRCDESSHRGPFFCFARRHDLDVVVPDASGPNGFSKIAGSAQRRTAAAILQHGSIILDSRFEQQPVATWKSHNGPTDFTKAVELLMPAFEGALGLRLDPAEWRDEELDAAFRFEGRYAGRAWTVDRDRAACSASNAPG
ncbi:MAG TPA: biotin/lipoate A/B protein ligase family protein [Phycisphaerae bacterium]|nr:biotin/lipoate A/B protein ligase family protein [Phycisphaerae bacterium]